MKLFKIIISWLLVIIWLILIFYLSNQTGTDSMKASTKTIEQTLEVGASITNKVHITEESTKQKENIKKLSVDLNYPARKIMHFLEYLVLFLLLYNAFTISNFNKYKFIIIIIICIIYAISDEYHQLFRDRTSSYIDVLIDTFGSLIGMFLIKLRLKRKS